MRFVPLMVLFLSTIVVAADRPESAKLITDPLRESVQSEVSVSGNVIVGVMTLAAAGAITENQLVVQSEANIKKKPSKVCLRIASRDGIYTSRNDYEVPIGESRRIHLPYESKHRKQVEPNVSDDNIALAATPGDCDSGSSKFLLVSGQELTGRSDAVIYLNSFGATDVFYKLNKNAPDVPCEYVTEGRRTTFDYICRLGSIAAGVAVPVTIIRERFGREQPPIKITIVGIAEVDVPQ